jgi:hypothetical protein
MTITSHIDIFAEILNSSFFTMKQSEIKKKYPYVERDISWMYFNQRILLEAARPEVPLLERLTFLGIYSNNLDEFFRVLMFLLGFILIMGGVQQIASLSMARRWMPVPGAFYLIPSLILIAGIIALFNPTGARNTAFIIIGISSLVYSLSELINWFKFARRRPKAPVMHDDDDIEDAKIIE